MGKPELAMYAKEDGTGRAYKHPFRLGEDGKPLQSPSVTTVLKLVSKGDGVVQWAVNETVNWIAENQNLIYVKATEDIKRWGKFRWKDARDIRAEVGTGVHETIEALHTGSWNFPVLDDEQRRIMAQWDLFNERYDVTPHRTEFTVWNPTPNVDTAGTVDGLWDVTDTVTGDTWTNLYIDLKTSKNTWPEHWMQLSTLRNSPFIMEKQPDGTWVEVPAPESDGVAIVHLREDFYEFLPLTNPEKINNFAAQFTSYRRLWGLNKELDQIEKAEALDKYERF